MTRAEAPQVLSLDLGSSSVRAVTFDAALNTLRVARRPVALRQDSSGGSTFDANGYLAAAAACVDDLHSAGELRGVDTVAASCQWHSLVPVDGRYRSTGPALSWMDTRARPTSPGPPDPAAFHQRTGAWWHGLYWPVRIGWLRAEGVTADRWTGLGEYLAFRWLGAPLASISSASGTGALDTATGEWDPEALELAGVTANRLPPLAPDDWRGRLVVEFAHRWPDLAEASWALPIGDGAASALGSGGTPDRLSVTVGTSAAVRFVVSGSPAVPELAWRYRLDRERSVLGVAYSAGGALFDWVTQLCGEVDEAALATLAPGQHGLVSLPYHAGHRPPLPATATGTLHGLRLSTTPVDVIAATLEGVCHELAHGAQLLDPDGGAIAVLGGGAVTASPWLARRLAAALAAREHPALATRDQPAPATREQKAPATREQAALAGQVQICLEPEVGARGAAILAAGSPMTAKLEVVPLDPVEMAAMAAAGARHRDLRDRLAHPD